MITVSCQFEPEAISVARLGLYRIMAGANSQEDKVLGEAEADG